MLSNEKFAKRGDRVKSDDEKPVDRLSKRKKVWNSGGSVRQLFKSVTVARECHGPRVTSIPF